MAAYSYAGSHCGVLVFDRHLEETCIVEPVSPPLLVALTTLAQTGTAPASIDAARKATLMFTLVALSLGVVLLLAVLLVLARRTRRRQATAPRPTGVLVDPWSESARRVQPFESQNPPE
jgi:hypothetical protein